MEEELNNLIAWLKENELRISNYLPTKAIIHPVLKHTATIDNIIKAIKKGDLNAIELGCNLAIENKHIPFGRTLKCNIFNSLRSQENFISNSYKEKLTQLAIAYLNSPYPPKESKMLCRLIKRFEKEYSSLILSNVQNKTVEADRWLRYLKD
jgi:hypothetical protein